MSFPGKTTSSVEYNDPQASFCTRVLQRMNTFRHQGLLCDVTITAEQTDFAAHKGILAASSDYFQALFTTAMIEKDSEKIYLEVSSSIVNDLLTFLYTGKTDINEANVIELLVAADYLVIHELKEQCADYLVHLLSSVTCIKIYTLALQCNCPVLRAKTERFILKNFVSVLENEDFNSLDCYQFEGIINNDDLVVNGEEDVYKAILLWMNGCEERKPYFERLFGLLRLSSLPEDFIINNIENEPLVRQSPTCKSLVHQRLHSSTFSSTSDDIVQVIQPRKCLRKEFQGLVVVGGISGGKVLKDTLVFNPIDKSWTALEPSECEREEHVVVACKGSLYVIGGMKRSQSIDCYDPRSNTWSTVAHLPERAITSAGVCLDCKIFIIGGKNGFETVSWVYCFDPSNNQVQRAASLTFPRKALCAVALEGEIYAIGGCTYDNDSLNVVEKMNPNDGNEWKQISPLREHRKYASAEVLANKKILVVGGYQDTNPTALDSCEVYSTETKEWQMVCSLVMPRAASAMACIDNQLYIVGGRTDRRSTDTIEYYDENNNQWCMSPVTLPYPCAWMQCTVLDVPKTLLHDTAQTP
ncbi:kelch-like protein 20 [Actinia tenebrosa]|uniref:Kelch-like protein 20 n=1 Tax=Actinia tenebrosa TaxID=6105 RepID=A0A6P8HR56_ACTTE|nr:kelch-like protein 20 [Actinia tenebrosa]